MSPDPKAGRNRMRLVAILGLVIALGVPMGSAGQSPLGPVVGVIGVAEGPPEQVFGDIQDVEATSAGYFAVVDGQWKEVRVFGPTLEHVKTLGRAGNGPAEFAGTALSAGIESPDVLVVSDAASIRLTRMALSGEPEFLDFTRTVIPPTWLCTGDGRVFTWHLLGDQVISEIARDGGVVRHIGQREVPASDYFPVLRSGGEHFLNQASIGCDAELGVVVAVHQFHSVVKAYSFEGERRWRTELSDYHQQRFERSGGSCCDYLIPDPRTGTYHVGLEALTPGDGHAYVTLRESGPRTQEGGYEVRVLRVSDGREVSRFTTRGILSAVAGGKAYVIEPYPIPRVWVHEWLGTG